jgi:hypothetical protein
MHKLFLVYFINLYMFRAYLSPSSGCTTVCIQQLVIIVLFDEYRPGWIHNFMYITTGTYYSF